MYQQQNNLEFYLENSYLCPKVKEPWPPTHRRHQITQTRAQLCDFALDPGKPGLETAGLGLSLPAPAALPGPPPGFADVSGHDDPMTEAEATGSWRPVPSDKVGSCHNAFPPWLTSPLPWRAS